MKNKKAFAVWSRNVKKFNQDDILELRRSLSIPDEGFKTSKECDVWENEAKMEFAEFGEITDFTEKAKNYERIVKSKLYLRQIAVKNIINNFPELRTFSKIIDQYLFFDYVPDWMLETINATGCNFDFIIDKSPNLEQGLYIRVNKDTTINDIKLFLRGRSDDLNWYKTLAYGAKGRRVKSTKADQNNVAYNLNAQDLDSLVSIYKALSKDNDEILVFTRKDIVIVRIMNVLGYKVTPESVRQIISREKKRRSV